MEIITPRSTRRSSTRLRVEIPVTVTSMDRRCPFAASCMALVVSPQGCGFQSTQALPLETPVLLADLPGGANASGRVASCLPLGNDGKYFLVGVSLYNPGNVWGIANPPEDWNCVASAATASATTSANDPSKPATQSPNKTKEVWPYNLFSDHGEAHPGRK